MDFNRKFEHVVDGKQVIFDVTYNPQTHFFHVRETDDSEEYLLKFDMASRTWSIDGTSHSKISADELAALVQKNFGHFV
ncbi:hypothetical protein PQ465_08125 [Sphingobacterium oryzagri]|uniref:Uncharacterized protein n=1 Tax=Sphingobacterium oryzagri TaxID=3025669 RepID=A0ABY7WSQ7_9SPHI|nr:hypothetical protein [Sphingobacterium sp. KACC 22765]WDF70334.1 hypothetical protein PQ465_08125 [Sphingobacterium sp. KACC 22765]